MTAHLPVITVPENVQYCTVNEWKIPNKIYTSLLRFFDNIVVVLAARSLQNATTRAILYILNIEQYNDQSDQSDQSSNWSVSQSVKSISLKHNLAHSAKLPTGLYILLALMSLFFPFNLFLMISRRAIISGSAGLIFAIFSPNESVLGADDRPGSPFSISPGTLPWQTILWRNGKLPTFVALTFRNGTGYRYPNVRINRVNDASISCKIFVNSRRRNFFLWWLPVR